MYRLLTAAVISLTLASRLVADCVSPPEKIKVTLVAILASEEGETTDKRLQAIARELRKENPNLKRLVIHSLQNRSLAEKEEHVFQILENQTVKVTVHEKADKNNKVILAVTTPDGKIDYSSVCGKFLPIVTCYQTQSKERLIVAVRVEPCSGD